jgi:hypothetical protein
MGNREAIAFGDAVTVPMRMQFSELDSRYLPKTATALVDDVERSNDAIDLRKIVMSMRQVEAGEQEMTEPASLHGRKAGSTSEVSHEVPSNATDHEHENGEGGVFYFDSASPAPDSEELRLQAMRRLEERRAAREPGGIRRSYSFLEK